MIEINEISKAYGSKTIIHKWTYRFENGKVYRLIGRNGIGKTTIMKCICGLCEPDSIQLFTDEGDVSKADYLKRNIYYVSSEPTYYNDLTVYEHLWIICKVEGYTKQEAMKKIDELVKRFNLDEYLNYYPVVLSTGTLQRMMLMLAFIRKSTFKNPKYFCYNDVTFSVGYYNRMEFDDDSSKISKWWGI